MDVNLDQFSRNLFRIKVSISLRDRYLNRSNVSNLLEVDPDDYRTIYGKDHMFRGLGNPDPVYNDIKHGISWGTAKFYPKRTDPETVEDNLERLGEAVLDGDIEPPFDEEDRTAVLEPEEQYDDMAQFRVDRFNDTYSDMSLEEDNTSLTVKQFGGPATLYRFVILDKPDERNGTLLYQETEDHTRSGRVEYRSEQPPETVLDRLDDIGYPEVMTTNLDREKLQQSADLRQMDQQDLQDASSIDSILDRLDS